MAQDPGAHLDRLPDELLLDIIEQSWPCSCGEAWCLEQHQSKVLSPRDVISLACTSRRHYRIMISAAYERHVKEQSGLAIYWAIENEQYATLKRLVESGVDVNMPVKEPVDCPRDIGSYFFDHDLEHTKAFMEPDSEAHAARFTPLAWAASHGQDSMIRYLLDHGPDIEKESENLCFCHNSKLLSRPQMFPGPPEFYLKQGLYHHEDDDSMVSVSCCGEPVSRFPEWRPLHYALCKGHESTAQLLIERGADKNEVGVYSGVTALHIATRWELDDTIDYLLDNDRVNINAQNSRGITALHMAQVAGRDDLVDKYLDKGADINLEYSDRSGPWTIFVLACAAGDYKRALEYLKIGADPHFVLADDDFGDPWTVMRVIYCSTSNVYKCSVTMAEDRMKLEREIIARGKGGSATT